MSAMAMNRMAVVWPCSVAVGLAGTYGFHRRTMLSSPPVATWGGAGVAGGGASLETLPKSHQSVPATPTNHIPCL